LIAFKVTTLPHLPNFLRIDERLATSGMPQPHDFAALRQAGLDAVINLALPSSDNALPKEGELVSVQGMTYVQIPVKFDAPQPVDFERFTPVLDACAGQRVFVHCAVNKRVSAFVFLHRLGRGTTFHPPESALQIGSDVFSLGRTQPNTRRQL
jgi:protein tyrosine phosphatase (PTP) superfamily phosphohydrolase (DUF442 family)